MNQFSEDPGLYSCDMTLSVSDVTVQEWFSDTQAFSKDTDKLLPYVGLQFSLHHYAFVKSV